MLSIRSPKLGRSLRNGSVHTGVTTAFSFFEIVAIVVHEFPAY